MRILSVTFISWIKTLLTYFFSYFKSSHAKNLEILALKSQLALYEQKVVNKKITKPNANPFFRQLWVVISKLLPNWKEILDSFQPDTIIGWHRSAFKKYWYKKSSKGRRPIIDNEIVAIIKRIKKDNPFISAEKIHELLLSLNIEDAPCANTISKYLPTNKKPPTKKPDTNWLIQQLRNATPYNHKPKYLIHDNDPAFVSKEFQNFLNSSNIKSKPTSYYSPCQNGISERLNGILRQEVLNHIIPINEKHVTNILKEYKDKYYNTHRTHQGIDCKTPIPLKKQLKTTMKNTKLIKTPVLNGLYHTYKKAA